MAIILNARTDIEWINKVASIPILGDGLLFVFMFLPAVILSFIIQTIIPPLNNDIGFTKAMLVLLPGWNLLLWIFRIRLYLFLLPAWILLGGIAIVKVILLFTGIDDGQ